MKKTIAVILCGLMVLVAMAGCAEAAEPVSATVTVKGFNGNVDVTVTLTDDVITDVTAVGPDETEEFGQKAIAQLPGKMVEANSVDVDAVTGATGTSNAIKKAAKAAVFQLAPSRPDADPAAWAEVNGYVLSADYNIHPDIDALTGASYQIEVASQNEKNHLTQEEAKELAQDYLRGWILYYDLAEGSDIPADRIYIQSNIHLFEYLNATGGDYQYGDTYVGVNGTEYVYCLPSYQIDIEDYKAAIQLGLDTEVTDEEFIAAIGEPYWSYREMYAVGTAFNNVPGLAESEAVLDPESMNIYLGSDPGNEKCIQIPLNPTIKMFWVKFIEPQNYVSGSDPTDNDYYHSYGVRIEGTAGAVKMEDVIDTEGNILKPSVIRGGIRYGQTLIGAQDWFEGKPDADMTVTAALLAETRYYADKWAEMTDEEKTEATAEVRAYMANIYLGNIDETNMNPIDAKEIEEKGVTLKGIMNPFMNRSGEGYAIRLSSTGALLEVNVDEFLTDSLFMLTDLQTMDQVELFEAGDDPLVAKWVRRFYELYEQRAEGQGGVHLRRQVYYANEDTTLDR